MRVLADLVLVVHVAVVLFVVGGLVAVLVGARRGWSWVDAPAFRLAHLAAIGVVVAEAWLGVACPLTTLEASLRARSGGAAYAGGFVEHWLGRLIYFDAPPWVFTLLHTGFGLAVVATWWRHPPDFGGRRHAGRPRAGSSPPP
jgi:hypothetical protein